MILPSENSDFRLLMTTITKRFRTKLLEIPEEQLSKRHLAIDETRRWHCSPSLELPLRSWQRRRDAEFLPRAVCRSSRHVLRRHFRPPSTEVRAWGQN